jgi:hypothetical protein
MHSGSGSLSGAWDSEPACLMHPQWAEAKTVYVKNGVETASWFCWLAHYGQSHFSGWYRHSPRRPSYPRPLGQSPTLQRTEAEEKPQHLPPSRCCKHNPALPQMWLHEGEGIVPPLFTGGSWQVAVRTESALFTC